MIKIRLPEGISTKPPRRFLRTVPLNKQIICIFWLREMHEELSAWAMSQILSDEFPTLGCSVGDMFRDIVFSYELDVPEYLAYNAPINKAWMYAGYNAVVKNLIDGKFTTFLLYNDILKILSTKKQTLRFTINNNPLDVRGLVGGYLTFCMGSASDNTKFFLGALLYGLFHEIEKQI